MSCETDFKQSMSRRLMSQLQSNGVLGPPASPLNKPVFFPMKACLSQKVSRTKVIAYPMQEQ